MSARVGLAWLSLVGLCGLGCGSNPDGQQRVSGTVIFEGKPLDQGQILFIPAVTGPYESGAGIENGEFEIPQEHGLTPGSYKVRVFSYDKTGPKVNPTDMPGEGSLVQFAERIPAKYNTQTTLTADVKSGPNRFEFKLE